MILYADIYFAETQYNECADIIDVSTESIDYISLLGEGTIKISGVRNALSKHQVAEPYHLQGIPKI